MFYHHLFSNISTGLHQNDHKLQKLLLDLKPWILPSFEPYNISTPWNIETSIGVLQVIQHLFKNMVRGMITSKECFTAIQHACIWHNNFWKFRPIFVICCIVLGQNLPPSLHTGPLHNILHSCEFRPSIFDAPETHKSLYYIRGSRLDVTATCQKRAQIYPLQL